MNLYLSLPPFSNKYVSDSAKNPATRLSLGILFYIQKKLRRKVMTYKTLTAIHERRMTIVQIGIPVAIGAVYLYEHPELKTKIKNGCKKVGNKILHPFKKKKEVVIDNGC